MTVQLASFKHMQMIICNGKQRQNEAYRHRDDSDFHLAIFYLSAHKEPNYFVEEEEGGVVVEELFMPWPLHCFPDQNCFPSPPFRLSIEDTEGGNGRKH